MRSIVALAMVGAAAACSDDDPAGPAESPLAGLSPITGRDSTGTPVPPPPSTASPGYFRGTVLGPSAPGSGNDSLATAPRVTGVRVTAYPLLDTSTSPPEVGPEAASVVTGTDGKFQLPVLPAGEYVVTFNPPESSVYGGVWVTATAHSMSHDHPWWVVLWLK